MNPKALLSAIVQVDVSGWDAQQPDASDVDLRRAEEERLQRLESEEFSRQLADELDDEPDDTSEDGVERSAADLQRETPAAAAQGSRVEFRDLTKKDRLNLCIPSTVLSVQWGVAADGALQFYLAVVLPRGEKTGKESVRIHWLDEYELNTYKLSSLKPEHKPEDIGIVRVLDAPHVNTLPTAADGTPRWQLVTDEEPSKRDSTQRPQPQSQKQSATAPTETEAAVGRQVQKSKPADTRQAQTQPSQNAKQPDQAQWTAEPAAAVKQRRQPQVSGGVGAIHGFDCIISNDPFEWLNGLQLRNAAAQMLSLDLLHDAKGLACGLQLAIEGESSTRTLHVFDPFSASDDNSNVARFLLTRTAQNILVNQSDDAVATQVHACCVL
jgi:hypothetical protein